MTFAVIIPLYNHEAYIGDAIRSLLTQSRQVDRIIVVDDGSTDGSADRVREFDDARILLITQANAGAHAALNRGIKEAGDAPFLGILNSDDLYEPDRVEKCLAFLEKHSGFDVVCTGLRMIDPAGAALKENDPKVRWLNAVWANGSDDLFEWLGIANFAKSSSNLIGRSAYFQAHPFRPYRFVHDYFFLLICALEKKLGVLPEPLLRYRAHSGNTIKTSPREDVIRETVAMNLDVLREAGSELSRSRAARAGYARYLRELFGNHSDFRAELFVRALAELAGKAHAAGLSSGVDALRAGDFPELLDGPGRILKQRFARREFLRLERELLKSRWYSLGRTLGLTRNVLVEDHRDAEAMYALLKKRVKNSRWLSIGHRFGLFRSGLEG